MTDGRAVTDGGGDDDKRGVELLTFRIIDPWGE